MPSGLEAGEEGPQDTSERGRILERERKGSAFYIELNLKIKTGRGVRERRRGRRRCGEGDTTAARLSNVTDKLVSFVWGTTPMQGKNEARRG